MYIYGKNVVKEALENKKKIKKEARQHITLSHLIVLKIYVKPTPESDAGLTTGIIAIREG